MGVTGGKMVGAGPPPPSPSTKKYWVVDGDFFFKKKKFKIASISFIYDIFFFLKTKEILYIFFHASRALKFLFLKKFCHFFYFNFLIVCMYIHSSPSLLQKKAGEIFLEGRIYG